MKAVVQDRYGTADVLALRDAVDPVVGEGDVLVRVHAAGCGPDVWHIMTGRPYMARPTLGLRRPRSPVRGWDVSGRRLDRFGVRPGRRGHGDRRRVLRGAGGRSAGQVGAQAGQALVRGGRGGAGLWSHRTSGPSRRGRGAVRPDGVGDRCRRWGRHVHRANSEGVGGKRHRHMQHLQGGAGPFDRSPRRDRLHARGLHRRVAALGT